MTLKEKAISKTRECDLLNREIANLRAKEMAIRTEINQIKKEIVKEKKHLYIGKEAVCSNSYDPNFKDILCTCTYLHCNEFFDVVPKFERKGKRVDVDLYMWIFN